MLHVAYVTLPLCRFKEEVEKLYKNLKRDGVQHMLWSATVPSWIKELTKFMKDPQYIDLIGAAVRPSRCRRHAHSPLPLPSLPSCTSPYPRASFRPLPRSAHLAST